MIIVAHVLRVWQRINRSVFLNHLRSDTTVYNQLVINYLSLIEVSTKVAIRDETRVFRMGVEVGDGRRATALTQNGSLEQCP